MTCFAQFQKSYDFVIEVLKIMILWFLIAYLAFWRPFQFLIGILEGFKKNFSDTCHLMKEVIASFAAQIFM